MSGAFVYMLLCEDGSFYTGWTNDVEKRFAAHKSGAGAKYTRAHRPVAVAYAERCASKREAMQREAAIKRLTHTQKQALCAGGAPVQGAE